MARRRQLARRPPVNLNRARPAQPLVPLQRPEVPCQPAVRGRSWDAYGQVAASFGSWYYRYRWELAPVSWAAATFTGGVAAYALGWATTMTVGAAIWAGVAIAVRRWKSGRYRLHAHAAAATTGSWLTAASIWGPTSEPVLASLLAGTAVVGIPWWLNRAVRDHIEMNREKLRWSEVAEKIGAAGSRIMRRKKIVDEATGREVGWEARIELKPGQTYRTLETSRQLLESFWGLRIGAVQVSKVPSNARQADIRVVHTDTFAAKGELEHPALTDPNWTAGSRSILDPIPVGAIEDGAPLTLQLAGSENGVSRGLTMGAAGGGKSNWINVKLAAIAACRDAVIWYGETAKAAAKARPWKGRIRVVASTPAEVVKMLEAAVGVIADRGKLAAERFHDDAIPPGRDVPVIYIVLDEFAAMVKDPTYGQRILELATQIAQTGRSLLVSIDIHSQHGSAGAFGFGSASQLLAQLNIRACFRLQQNSHARFIFPSHYQQIDAAALPHDGSFYLSVRPDAPPVLARVYALYSPEKVRKVADRLSQGPCPRLDARSEAVARRILGSLYMDPEPAGDNAAEFADDDLPKLGPASDPLPDDEADRLAAKIADTIGRLRARTDEAFARANQTRALTGGRGYMTPVDDSVSESRTATTVLERPRVDNQTANLDDTDRGILRVLDLAPEPVSSTAVAANFEDVSHPTVKRRLAGLQARGLVRLVGQGRNARWTLAQRDDDSDQISS